MVDLLVGPLADTLLEPRLAVGGAWTSTFSPWVGSGPGTGIPFPTVMEGVGDEADFPHQNNQRRHSVYSQNGGVGA